MPLPERIQNAPELWIGLQMFYRGFLDLVSERSYGMAAGPIPYMKQVEYCVMNGIDGEQREDFVWLVSHLDAKYLEWSTKRG